MPSKKRVVFVNGNQAFLSFNSLREWISVNLRPFKTRGASANIKELERMLAGAPELLGLSVLRDKQHYRKSRRPYLLMMERVKDKKEKKAKKVVRTVAAHGQGYSLDDIIQNVRAAPRPSPLVQDWSGAAGSIPGHIAEPPTGPYTPPTLDERPPERHNYDSWGSWAVAYEEYRDRVTREALQAQQAQQNLRYVAGTTIPLGSGLTYTIQSVDSWGNGIIETTTQEGPSQNAATTNNRNPSSNT